MSTLVTDQYEYSGNESVRVLWSRICTSTLVMDLYEFSGHGSV